jgi:hypothetical protein
LGENDVKAPDQYMWHCQNGKTKAMGMDTSGNPDPSQSGTMKTFESSLGTWDKIFIFLGL